jgi:hypothetical protein
MITFEELSREVEEARSGDSPHGATPSNEVVSSSKSPDLDFVTVNGKTYVSIELMVIYLDKIKSTLEVK